MKKLLLILSCIFVFAFSSKANYVLNNNSIDQLFASATEVQITNLLETNSLDFAGTVATISSEKNAIVAAILAWFLGGFAIHRYYLGTKGSMFFYYFCTFGGIFGIVPLIDFVMLLVNSKDISKYCNNEKFIMW